MAPESLSKQLCGAPVGTVRDMIQMRPATICLMADIYRAGREKKSDEKAQRQSAGQMKGLSIPFEKDTKGDQSVLFVIRAQQL